MKKFRCAADVDKIQSSAYNELRKQVKKIRDDENYSQEKMAEVCNVSVGTIKRLEEGIQISWNSILRMALSLHLPLAEVFLQPEGNHEIIQAIQVLLAKVK